jgi:hypothetical protein
MVLVAAVMVHLHRGYVREHMDSGDMSMGRDTWPGVKRSVAYVSVLPVVGGIASILWAESL